MIHIIKTLFSSLKTRGLCPLFGSYTKGKNSNTNITTWGIPGMSHHNAMQDNKKQMNYRSGTGRGCCIIICAMLRLEE